MLMKFSNLDKVCHLCRKVGSHPLCAPLTYVKYTTPHPIETESSMDMPRNAQMASQSLTFRHTITPESFMPIEAYSSNLNDFR